MPNDQNEEAAKNAAAEKVEAERAAAEKAQQHEAKRAAEEQALRDRIAQLEEKLETKVAGGTITINAKNEVVEV